MLKHIACSQDYCKKIQHSVSELVCLYLSTHFGITYMFVKWPGQYNYLRKYCYITDRINKFFIFSAVPLMLNVALMKQKHITVLVVSECAGLAQWSGTRCGSQHVWGVLGGSLLSV